MATPQRFSTAASGNSTAAPMLASPMHVTSPLCRCSGFDPTLTNGQYLVLCSECGGGRYVTPTSATITVTGGPA